MSLPNRLPARIPTSPPPIPILGPQSSLASIRAWIQEWQFHRAINVSSETLNSITWTSSQLTTRSAKKLSADLISWGFLPGEARVLVADILAGMGRDEDRRDWESDERNEEIAAIGRRALMVAAFLVVIYSGARTGG
ncbi:hypothetical protein N431DRAFT_87325 [Stipitochalara longipes BDJ]|nr:hypothetical protein N431DRAFT_87325 [Stipitochalara longipes BDJ]